MLPVYYNPMKSENEKKILEKLESIATDVKQIKKAVIQEQWISEKEAAQLAGISVSNLRRLRRAGEIKDWRKRSTGRGVQYLKSALEKVFKTK